MSNPPPQITFYDIASGPPTRPYAPNPWKTRYALNFKRIHTAPSPTPLHYRTAWTDLAAVPAVRAALAAAPVRRHALDNTPFPTLPVIVIDCHPPTPQTIGDSFAIAQHLDAAYPHRPTAPPAPHHRPAPRLQRRRRRPLHALRPARVAPAAAAPGHGGREPRRV